jgi:hypothetical protein
MSEKHQRIRFWVVVAGLLGVLMLLEEHQGMRESFTRVKKTSSQKVCVEVASAVNSYFADYEKFPTETTTTGSDIKIDDTGIDGVFLGILNATGETQYNPRHIKYIDGMKQAKYVGGRFVDGINFEGDERAPTLTDPWGRGYKVIMDGNCDGKIDDPEPHGTDGSGATNPAQPIKGKKCIVYGAGPDGDFQTWRDNPKSW